MLDKKQEGTAAGATVTLAGAFRGLMATLAANPLIAITLGIIAAGAAMSKISKIYSDAAESAQEAQSTYSETASKLESVNDELQTTQNRIKELQALSANGTITLAEEAELQKLQQQNAELEPQKKLLEATANTQRRSATNAAMDALTVEGSQSQYSKDYNLDAVPFTNVIDAAKQDIKHLQDLYSERAKLNKQLDAALNSDDTQGISSAQKQLEENQAEIDKYSDAISGTITELQGYRDTLSQDINLGEVTGGQETLSELENVISAFSNLGEYQNEASKALQQLDTFFDGSAGKNAISNQILDMVKAGEEASDAIGKIGLSLSALGLEESQIPYLNQYFKDLADSATEAADAVDEIDSSLSGIQAAGESQNQGADFDTYLTAINNATRYFAEGKTGIDDFTTVASSLNDRSQDAADNLEKFSGNIERISKYLTVDEDSKLTQSSSNKSADGTIKSLTKLSQQYKFTKQNADDLAAVMNKVKEETTKTGKEFKSTAELAKELNIPVDFLEYAMGKMQEYNITAPFEDLPKSSQALNQAKTQLQSLKELYESMDEGGNKDALGEKIAGWEQQISTANNDLEALDTDIVLNMKLEYDIASLQAQIDAAKNQAEMSGDSVQWATSISTQMTLVNELESSGIEVPVELKTKADELQNQLKEAVASGNTDLAKELYPQVSSAYQDVIDDMVGKFNDENPTMDVDADTSKADSKIQALDEKTMQEKLVELNAEDNATDKINIWNSLSADEKFTSLSADDQATAVVAIWNALSADEKFTSLSAEDQATYVISLWNELLPESKTTNIEAKDKASSKVKKVDKIKINDKRFQVILRDLASGGLSSIIRKLNGIHDKTFSVTQVNRVVNTSAGTQGNVTHFIGGHADGTAHYNGTTNSGTSHASGDWGVQKDEDALINEVGKEVVVRDGKWFTVNNGYPAFTKLKKGDIVFNHKQTEELMRKGYVTNSHANIYGSYSNGSAHADGTMGGVAFATGTSNKNTIDWIEIALQRLEAIANKYSTKVENAFLTLATRLSNLSSTINATKTQLFKQQTAYNGYMAEANKVKLSANLKQKVRDGAYYVYDGYSDAEKEAVDKYKDLIDKANQCKEAMDELSQSLAELYKQAFEIAKTRYDNEFDALSNQEQLILNNIELAEAQGYSANPTDYESLIQYMQREVTKGQAEYAELVKKMNNAVASGNVKKFSDEWWDMYNATLEVAAGIQEADIALKEYQQDILNLKWDNFDYMQEQISQITKETDFLIDLLSKAELFDDSGKLTDSGIASLSLRNKQMEVYTKQAKDYAEEINNIDKLLADDPANKNLIDRRNELLESQRDAIQSVQDEKDAIKDLIEDAYDAQVDALQDIVDAYSDSLDSSKDLLEYQRKIQEGTANLASLQKQLDIYSNDTSEEARAKAQKLQVEFEDAQKDLEETQYDQYVSETKKMLDNLVEDYKEALFAGLDDIDSLLSDILSSVENPAAVKQTIEDAVHDAGYAITDDLSKIIRTDNVESILNSIDKTMSELLSIVDSVALNQNNDPIIDSDGNVTKLYEGVVVKDKNYGGFADGGFIAEAKKQAYRNGDDIVTINTLKAGEAVLTPVQTQAIQDFAPVMEGIMPKLSLLDNLDFGNLTPVKNVQNSMNMGDMIFNHEWNINIENADNWQDTIYHMQHDPQFPKFVRSMTVDLAMGGHPLAYTKYWNQ